MRRHSSLFFFFTLVAAPAYACHHGEPPMPNVDGAVAPLPGPGARPTSPDDATSAPTGSAVKGLGTQAGTAREAGSNAEGSGSSTTADVAQDAGVDPGTQPQTRDKPKASGEAFNTRMAMLWEAITHDDPERAIPAFFPVTAYEQVKAIPSPASDWRRRLVAAYKRDIHALHTRLGETATRAKFVRTIVPEERARWVEPNEETNKLGYYRVYGTRILYEVDGKERSFDVSSLISWRGEWYVVHLTGFK
jgi:hypothetical protein